MTDEFLAFLAAGLFLLVIGLLIVTAVQPSEIEKPAVATVFETNFDVAYLSKHQEVDLGSKKLFSGVLFGSNSIRQHIESEGAENLTVKFTVASTNNLAPLEITVNGKRAAWGRYAAGDHTVEIPPELLSSEIDVEIKPWSSLWKLWAPNQYTLKKVKLEIKSLSFGKKEFTFPISSDNFEQARMEFVMDKNIGRMKVQLNDKELFSGFMKNEQSISIKKSDLKNGENRLELIPDTNSKLSGIARLVMFSETPPRPPATYRPLFSLEADP